MKNILWIIPIIMISVALMGCTRSNKGSLPGEVNFDKDASYAVGLNIGSSLREGMAADQVYPDINEFLKGMRDGMEGRQGRFDLEEARQKIETAFTELQERLKAEAIQKETDYLAENAKKPGVIITPSGLQYVVVTEGAGNNAEITDNVLVHYHGKFTNNNTYISTIDNDEPVIVEVTNRIKGLEEGLQLMNVGSKYTFTIPSELGFGEFGERIPWTGEIIVPPYSVLIFDVELLEIIPAAGE